VAAYMKTSRSDMYATSVVALDATENLVRAKDTRIEARHRQVLRVLATLLCESVVRGRVHNKVETRGGKLSY
jgi:hypothetical protein